METPGNSHKDRDQPLKKSKPKAKKDIVKVVHGEVKKTKRPLGERFKETFFSGDLSSVLRYVSSEVLLPALRNLIVDSTTKGIERMIYGDSQNRYRRSDPRYRYSYNSSPLSQVREPRRAFLPDQPPQVPRGPRTHDFGRIVIVSKEDAEVVLDRLIDIIDTYDIASVADLHDLVGIPTSYIDNNWGWTSLGHANVRQVREGFVLDLPSPEQID